ncbi:unnamed protein product [Cercospora beticola]|nr:unnamed protein product [Cercospora beticola]
MSFATRISYQTSALGYLALWCSRSSSPTFYTPKQLCFIAARSAFSILLRHKYDSKGLAVAWCIWRETRTSVPEQLLTFTICGTVLSAMDIELYTCRLPHSRFTTNANCLDAPK